MKKIVFSKQCDYDLDIAPFWLHWYRNVYQADLIVITPVKTKLSSVQKICEFYRQENLPLKIIKISEWHDSAIWDAQLKITASFIKEGEPFSAISADSDQFFEPPPEVLSGGEILYQRVNLISDRTPQLENLRDCDISAYLSFNLTAGYLKSFENSQIFATGHFVGSRSHIPDSQIMLEFHLCYRGIEHFISKVKNTAIDLLSKAPEGSAWKRQRRIYEEQGEAGLIAQYQAQCQELQADPQPEFLASTFVARASQKKVSTKKRPVLFPFSSSISFLSFARTQPGGDDWLGFASPRNEMGLVRAIIEGNKYALPSAQMFTEAKTIVDIGAHCGEFGAYCKAHNPEVSLYCFEPRQNEFDLLRRNLRSFPNVHFFTEALSNFSREAPFYFDRRKYSSGSLYPTPEKEKAPEPVTVQQAGPRLTELGLSRIDLLKINTNGSELDILQNLGGKLSLCRVIMVAFHSDEERRRIDSLLPGFSLYGLFSRSLGAGVLRYINPNFS